MKINGKDYEFKYPTFAIVKQANRLAKESPLLNDIQKLIECDESTEEYKAAVETWRKFCELVFVKVDDDLALEKISPHSLTEASTSFFRLAVAGQTEPKSS
jgi:hypothetical protein